MCINIGAFTNLHIWKEKLSGLNSYQNYTCAAKNYKLF